MQQVSRAMTPVSYACCCCCVSLSPFNRTRRCTRYSSSDPSTDSFSKHDAQRDGIYSCFRTSSAFITLLGRIARSRSLDAIEFVEENAMSDRPGIDDRHYGFVTHAEYICIIIIYNDDRLLAMKFCFAFDSRRTEEWSYSRTKSSLKGRTRSVRKLRDSSD